MIYLKSPSEITKIRVACQIIGELLDQLEAMIQPGVNTWDLDQYAESFIRAKGGEPAFKGYRVPGLKPFPGKLYPRQRRRTCLQGIPGTGAETLSRHPLHLAKQRDRAWHSLQNSGLEGR